MNSNADDEFKMTIIKFIKDNEKFKMTIKVIQY